MTDIPENTPEPVPATNQAGEVDIKQMVSRFLAWNLPSDFHPDAGITFKAAFNEHTEHPMTHEPTGTNLFTATQAEAMIRHLIDQPSPMKMAVDQDWLNAKIASDPDAECEAGGFSREWCLSMAAREGDVEIGAGSLDHPLRTAALATQPATSQEGEERAAIVSYIRRQSDRGADIGNEKPKGSTARAAFGGGSLALKRMADNIEAGEHVINDNAALATQPATSQEGGDALGAAMRNHCLRYGQSETLPPHEMADMLGWLMAQAGLPAPGPIAVIPTPPTETREAELQTEIERLRGLLIDPGDPAWEDARAVLVAELRKNGMETHADNIAVSHAVPVPSWIALNLIAHARLAPTPPTLSEDLRETIEQAVSVLERLPYGDWPGPRYSGKTVAANALIRRLRAALAQGQAS